MPAKFGKLVIEAIIIGRNDEYEPNWFQNLCSAIQYNRSLFENSRIDFRVCLVEYNPVEGEPLLGPMLAEKFNYARSVVVDPQFHKKLSTMPKHNIMFNFGYNVGAQTSLADFIIITCGDIFFGSDVAKFVRENELKLACMYRAERVSVGLHVDFLDPTTESLENSKNHTQVADCTQAPFNEPPYTNACGDFILISLKCYKELRGYDESIRHSRMHLDSRFCLAATMVGVKSELIGRVYHIDYDSSYSNHSDATYGDIEYNYLENLPYFNENNWGLKCYKRKEIFDRCLYIEFKLENSLKMHKVKLSRLTKKILFKTIAKSPKYDFHGKPAYFLGLESFESCGKEVIFSNSPPGFLVTTPEKRWSYAISLNCNKIFEFGRFVNNYKIFLSLEVLRGRIGACLVVDEKIIEEKLVGVQGSVILDFYISPNKKSNYKIIIRNTDFDKPTQFFLKKLDYRVLPKWRCVLENYKCYLKRKDEIQ